MSQGFNSEEYKDLLVTGMSTKKEVKPEDQFFHSIYIPALEREENHAGIIEQPGKLQIFGVQYNLSEVNILCLHIKQVLVKREEITPDNWKITCFSFQEGKFPRGTSGKVCPKNRQERQSVNFCSECRAEIIITGLYCDKDANLIKINDKPVFTFLRGHGMKSNAIYGYLEEIKKLELEPLIFKDNLNMENSLVKNKRFVTRITTAKEKNPKQKGLVNVFKLNMGNEVDSSIIPTLLEFQKRTLPQFKEKFDISSSLSQDEDNIQDNTKQKQENNKTEKNDALSFEDSFGNF